MRIPVYDDAKFHFFVSIFFGTGAILNAGYGYFAGRPELFFNTVLLAVLSICTYKLHKLYSKKEKVYN